MFSKSSTKSNRNSTLEPSGTRLGMWVAICAVLGVVAAGAVGIVKLTKRDQPMEATAADVSPASVGQPGTPLFDEVSAEESGVKFVHRLVPNHSLAYLYHSGYTCGGVCLGDVDGDALCDIYLVSGPDENRLFLNKGGFVFEEMLDSETLSGRDSWGVGASMSDVDGDGDLDIFVCNYESTNCLYRNDGVDNYGQLQFTECALIAGLQYAGPSQFPYFADFDSDGDLDLFLLTNRIYAPFGRPHQVASELGPDGQPRVKEKYARYFRVVRPSKRLGKTKPRLRRSCSNTDTRTAFTATTA